MHFWPMILHSLRDIAYTGTVALWNIRSLEIICD